MKFRVIGTYTRSRLPKVGHFRQLVGDLKQFYVTCTRDSGVGEEGQKKKKIKA